MNNEVSFIKEQVIKINASVIQEIRNKASENSSGKFRYCFHESEEASMQEMLFVVPKAGYARPHMHKDAAETHLIVEGEGYCILFDSCGNIESYFRISKADYFIYRIQKGIFHMVIPITRQLVIYEVREGKFDENTNIYAEWAPKEYAKEQIAQFKLGILQEIGGKV